MGAIRNPSAFLSGVIRAQSSRETAGAQHAQGDAAAEGAAAAAPPGERSGLAAAAAGSGAGTLGAGTLGAGALGAGALGAGALGAARTDGDGRHGGEVLEALAGQSPAQGPDAVHGSPSAAAPGSTRGTPGADEAAWEGVAASVAALEDQCRLWLEVSRMPALRRGRRRLRVRCDR